MSTDANLRVDVREEAGRLTVAVMTGSLDLHTAPSLYRQAIQVLDRRPSLILDLADVTFCDSSGLNTLLRLHCHAQAAGGRLTVAGPPAQLVRMLAVTGIDAVLPVYGAVAEARETYRAP
ncbi:anti-sigma factor antagonist [Streptomyces sp. NPDC007904]|jgi:anti-sigma B factor antagonist|uniref:STAS domain-containing protein n=1 Tax=Streptomyces sp. NPDC007904 TaxID=3364787 RepID=UPI0036E5AA86